MKGNNLFIRVQFILSSFSVTIYFIYLTNKNHQVTHKLSLERGVGGGRASSGKSGSPSFTDLHPEVTWVDGESAILFHFPDQKGIDYVCRNMKSWVAGRSSMKHLPLINILIIAF